jgi:hypothetical protein
MKKLLVLTLMTLLFSCDEQYTHIGQEIIDGKISAVKEGYPGRRATLPKIWVQTTTTTKEVKIPFRYYEKWKVGDSCLLIIEKYKEIPKEK